MEIEFKNRYGQFQGTGKIDLEDIDLVLNKYVNLMNNGYISVRKDGTNIGLHRIIMKADDKVVVDHENGIRSDNRKSNLRLLDNSKNGINRSKHKNNKSGHRGVFLYTHCKTPKWKAFITVNWKQISLGYFDDFDAAVIARLEAEKKYYEGYAPDNDRYRIQTYERTENKYKNN